MSALAAGIVRVKNIINVRSNALSYSDINDKFPDCIAWLQYYQLVSAIPKDWWFIMRDAVNSELCHTESLLDELVHKSHPTNWTYSKLITDYKYLQRYSDKWETSEINIDSDTLSKVLIEFYSCTSVTKLRTDICIFVKL